MTAPRFAHRAAAAALSLLLLTAVPKLLHAQQAAAAAHDAEPAWVFSPGVGLFTLLRLEAERTGAGPISTAFALGLHPMGVPSVEALIRRQLGNVSSTGAKTFADVAVIGFLPGTQFADDASSGIGLHLTLGRRWRWGERRTIQLRGGVALYHEIPKGDAGYADIIVLPVLGLDIGRQRSRTQP